MIKIHIFFYLVPSVEYVQALMLFYHLLDDESRIQVLDHFKSLFVSLIKEDVNSAIQTSRFVMIFHYVLCTTFSGDTASAYMAKQVFVPFTDFVQSDI